MAIGAYTVGIFTVPVELRANVFYAVPMNPLIAGIQMPVWLALIVGGLLAALVAFLIGTPVLRLRGDYLAIATLGFSEIIRICITNASSFTNGALGIKDIPPLNDVRYIFVVTAITFAFIAALINSSYGRAFKAIREDEIAAEAMGINLYKHKCLAFMISAFFAGIGGGLYGALLGTVDPKNFLFTLTYNFLLIIVLGGMGSITGSMLGAVIVTAGLEYLRIFDEPLEIFGTMIPLFRPGLRMVMFSALLMACVLFWRHERLLEIEITNEKLQEDTAREMRKIIEVMVMVRSSTKIGRFDKETYGYLKLLYRNLKVLNFDIYGHKDILAFLQGTNSRVLYRDAGLLLGYRLSEMPKVWRKVQKSWNVLLTALKKKK